MQTINVLKYEKINKYNMRNGIVSVCDGVFTY